MPAGRSRSDPGPRSGTVSRLVVLTGRPERTVVYLDGRRAGDIATEVVNAKGLRKGDTLAEDDLAELRRQDEPHRARFRALGLLGVRDRSATEIANRLRMAGFAPDIVEATVRWLRELDYIDDRRFSERYVNEKSRSGWGGRRIRAELLRKGVDRALVDEALALHMDDPEAESARMEDLLALVRKRFGRQWSEDRRAAERRLSAFLVRRGYDWDTVASVVRRMDAE
jgi:regulatory protein